MGALRVGSLALSLGLPEGSRDRAGAVQDRVERHFLPAVLDSLALGLDAAYGETAVIRVRRLRLRLRIGPEVRDAAELARQVGQDLASHVRDIAEVVRSPATRPPDDAEVTVWPTAAIWHAAALHAAMTGTEGPKDRIDTLPDVVERLLADPSDTPGPALAACAEAGFLPALLARLAAPVLRALLARTVSLPAPLRAELLAALAQAEAPRAATPGSPEMPDPQTGQPDAKSVTPGRTARPQHEPPAPGAIPGPTPVARFAADAPPLHPPTRHAAAAPARPDRPDGATTDPAAPVLPAASPSDPALSGLSPAALPAPLSPTPVREGTAADSQSIASPTAWGGLVYLVTLAFRLGLPEALWRIGVAEGAALAAMLTAISGAEDDPLTRALDPAFPGPPPPLDPIPDWARIELCTGMAAAARALTGRSATESAEPEDAFDLARWGADLLLRTFGDLIDRPPEMAALRDIFAVAGTVDVGTDIIRIRLPPSAISIDIRRAGLDADPGHLPWLGRRLVIAFGTGDEDWTG